MRKLCFISIFTAVFLGICSANAKETSTAQKLKQMLSESYGVPVEVQIDDENCEVVYPATEITEEVTEWVESDTEKDTLVPQIKTVTQKIPQTKAQCVQAKKFKSYDQYRIKVESAQKFLAQLYNQIKLPLVKDIEIKDFAEEMNVVPELGLIQAHKMEITDAMYTQTDDTTGLKREIGNLRKYILDTSVSTEDTQVKFNFNTSLEALNLALPLISVQIKAQNQKSEVVYDIADTKDFDYNLLINNLSRLAEANSSVEGSGIKFNSDMFGVGLSFDIHIRNRTQRIDAENISSFGDITLDNIAFSGDFLSKEKQPKALILKYSLKNIPQKNLIHLSEFSDELIAETHNSTSSDISQSTDAVSAQEQYRLEMYKALDKVMEQAKLVSEIELQFTNADVLSEFVAERKDGYLTGIHKITVKNLFNIFPQQKQCINNLNTNEIPECGTDFIFAALADFVDTTQDNSVTIYEYNAKGIYKNGTKIGEPIELNFEKMYKEEQAAKTNTKSVVSGNSASDEPIK